MNRLNITTLRSKSKGEVMEEWILYSETKPKPGQRIVTKGSHKCENVLCDPEGECDLVVHGIYHLIAEWWRPMTEEEMETYK